MSTDSFNPNFSQQAYLPSNVDIPDPTKNPELFYEVMNERERNTGTIVNLKDHAVYSTLEMPNCQQWPGATAQEQKLAFRKLVNFGAIAAGATSTVAHGITGITQVTRQWGEAITAVVDYRHIPYASATLVTDQIQLTIDAANVTIINGATAPNITSAVVVMEYLKN